MQKADLQRKKKEIVMQRKAGGKEGGKERERIKRKKKEKCPQLSRDFGFLILVPFCLQCLGSIRQVRSPLVDSRFG